mmetsp:Transcript_65226/g.170839  ORF Transcript_65226/g.170839 Transcript_65226/m.170839 type:complete len:250 (-) Transcript_65226:38-787(-)
MVPDLAADGGETSVHEVAAEGAIDSHRQAQAELAQFSLPAAAIKRMARSSVPGVRFSSEAVAALHRVAQAFICFATDSALSEQRTEAERAKRSRGKSAFVAKKTLSGDHVMKVLTSELGPIASKLASLFPELVPVDFRPQGIRLLEQLREQEREHEKAEAATEMEDAGGAALLAATAAAGTEAEGDEPLRKRAKVSDTAKGGLTEAVNAPVPLSRFFGKSAARAAAPEQVIEPHEVVASEDPMEDAQTL